MIDCSTAIERLYGYLDRELTDEEREEVERHLAKCPPCARFFNFEAGVLHLVAARVRETCAPPELRTRISALCQNAADLDR